MKKRKLKPVLILFLGIVLFQGCSKEAKVTIRCIGDPIRAGVDGEYRYINSFAEETWEISWSSSIFSSGDKEVILYAEDIEFPSVYNTSEAVKLSNGEHYSWHIGWSFHNSIKKKRSLIELDVY